MVVTRARDGEVRAFLNVCRHRGFPLAEGSGKRETLQCPYHAWTYGLDGSLRAAPRSDEEPDFPKSELGLSSLPVDTWGPFVFVNADRDAEPLAEALGSMPAQVAELGLDVDDEWIAELLAFDDQVGTEDRKLVEDVQRGVASGALPRGVLMGRSEQLISHFEALTTAALSE